MTDIVSDAVGRGLTAAAPRRNVLKGAGGLALGALGIGTAGGSEPTAGAAPRAQDSTPVAAGTGRRPSIVVIDRKSVV